MLLCSITFNAFGQSIPVGQSTETIVFDYSETISETWTIGYYKPANYDSLNGEIIWYNHGQGGDQNEGYMVLHEIADKRGALLVSPTSAWSSPNVTAIISGPDFELWLPDLYKEIYKHILNRENRDSINVRMLGFSAGGQCVTRYMLIRQGINDSIPIKMAISINPYFYTFCTDSLNEQPYNWPCGIGQETSHPAYRYMGSHCEEHVMGYYNENYTVMIGTADTALVPVSFCDANGETRYERAVNFYNFSEQNAIERGTTLQWYYAEVPDVGHNGYAMINTKANPEDTVTICEHYLFDMPYHEPQKFPPTADFSYSINDTTQCVEFNANCECWWQIQPTSYYWDFSNGISDTGMTVSVDLPDNGQYSVQLIASNIYGSDTIVKTVEVDNLPVADFTVSDTILILPDSTVIFTFSGSNADSILWDFGDGNFSNEVNPTHNYQDTGYFSVIIWVYNENSCVDSTSMLIEVINYNAIYELKEDGKAISIFPNPTTGQITISTGNEAIESIEIYDYLGRKKDEIIVNHRESLYIYNTKNMRGLYLFRIKTSENVYTERVWYRQ